ncbi:dihydrofolate reductase family protein [Antrihabitans cavernicola]|uniref:Dihydrofolate reductase n=1 Tax=Antrihabitans cavernicola TaxID=2495913 RepID=A0A5A7S3E0_9NOCA|nr:dihydrofolate reductase family protein [Spelaeibacter cavernicola]KAA0019407.1 dihydrofolate reductase [Spelaeibacter cavernicola]
MRELTYYVASTLDGFIAAPDGSFDAFAPDPQFLQYMAAEFPETLPVHARGPLGIAEVPNKHFDTVVMGRKTYDPAVEAGLTSAYPHLRQYVFSRTLGHVDDASVTVVAGNPVDTVRELKKENGLGIWLCGGGELAGQLAPEIDRLIVKVNPVVIGSGTPLFTHDYQPRSWSLVDATPQAGGVAVLQYER